MRRHRRDDGAAPAVDGAGQRADGARDRLGLVGLSASRSPSSGRCRWPDRRCRRRGRARGDGRRRRAARPARGLRWPRPAPRSSARSAPGCRRRVPGAMSSPGDGRSRRPRSPPRRSAAARGLRPARRTRPRPRGRRRRGPRDLVGALGATPSRLRAGGDRGSLVGLIPWLALQLHRLKAVSCRYQRSSSIPSPSTPPTSRAPRGPGGGRRPRGPPCPSSSRPPRRRLRPWAPCSPRCLRRMLFPPDLPRVGVLASWRPAPSASSRRASDALRSPSCTSCLVVLLAATAVLVTAALTAASASPSGRRRRRRDRDGAAALGVIAACLL